MSDKDLRQLRRVLEETVRASQMSIRDMERALGVGSGGLARLFKGELDLRVRHVLALAELVGVPPGDFLELGCPEALKTAKRRLADVIGRAAEPAAPTAASLTIEQLKELIRSTVREELEPQSAAPERKSRSRR